MKEVKGISKRIKDAQKEEKLPLKKHQLLKQNQMSSKILTLKDLLPELQSYGINTMILFELVDKFFYSRLYFISRIL